MTLTTEDKLRNIFVEMLGVDAGDITAKTHIIDDLGADSLDTIELAMEIEEQFGIEIDDEQFETANTFGDVLNLVNGKVSLC